MRIAVISDIHVNLTALEAVIADLRKTGADLVVHGGDLMSGGPRPAEVIDRIREKDWPGVHGNTDEMLWMPHRVSETLQAPHLHQIRDLVLTHTIPTTLAIIARQGSVCRIDGRDAANRQVRAIAHSRGVREVHPWTTTRLPPSQG